MEDRVSCEICGKSFAAQTDMEQHRRDAHKAGDQPKAKRSMRISKTWVVIVIFILLVIGGSVYWLLTPHASSGIDGVQCSAEEQAAFHIHTHLDVFVDGQSYIVPADIGIKNNCLYWLHTHDATGIIHIESPVETTYRLGQFLDIWGNSTADRAQPRGLPTAYVNGNLFSGDYKSIQLNAHDEIALIYGTAPSSIPSSYNFPSGL